MNHRSLSALGAMLATTLAASLAPRLLSPAPVAPGYTLVGWNDLGMHCMDSDYSVFSILPPYNTVEAQLIDPQGHLVTSPGGITVTYEAVADPGGSINSTSVGKTNYWTFAPALYGGSSVPNTGLAGHDMPGPGNVPQAMTFGAAAAVFRAEGVPVTPYDDQGRSRSYPLMRLVARDAQGLELASTEVVLPVSDEMDCSLCHGSNTEAAARPSAGWVDDPIHERDYRRNILRLHDEHHAGSPLYAQSLQAAGYDPNGLQATVAAGTPILCARCHASNALPGTGVAGVPPLTAAIHAHHAAVTDPINGSTLGASSNRAACYRCHPGSETRCLRGAMGAAVDAQTGDLAMQCQSCHGSMSDVGAATRQGWFDQPNCQSCHTGTATHNNGQIRYADAFDTNGSLRIPVDTTFATNPDTPLPGTSLYRFSTGHGGLRCEACHGSTHAVFPAAHGNDNLQNLALQGHAGTLVECSACHTTVPRTVAGGPHGLHPVDSSWIDRHPDVVETQGSAQCQVCHGTSYRGTVLSRAHADRTFVMGGRGTVTFRRGQTVGCYECHRGPNSGDPPTNGRPVAQGGSGSLPSGAPSLAIPLTATDPENSPLTLRVVRQPEHGTVTVQGATATYRPFGGFAGTDTFAYTAADAYREATPANVSVRRNAESVAYGRGFPGTGGRVPALAASAPPVLGTAIDVAVDNTAGVATVAGLLASLEPARLSVGFGGVLLVHQPEALTILLPIGGGAFHIPVPNVPALTGVVLHTQSIQIDPGARHGIAFSAGLRLVLGS
ncbi:MAG: hypothetical protein IPM29_07725 [Planctomycetes bacterium]|nr:hypothetical protein [Planctomycetota bacterium]